MTTRGRCLLAGGVAAIGCGIALDERDLLRVGLLALLLPLAAWALVASRRTRLVAEHFVDPPRLSAGTSGQVRLLITNDGLRRTSPIELREARTADLSPGTHCLIPSLAPGRSAVTTFPLLARRRGRFLIGPPRITLGDPFGTWEDHRTLPSRAEVLVVPAVVALHGSPASGGVMSARSGRSSKASVGGDPDVGIRGYHRGDDIRTVHWPSSARHDDLMVRLTEPVSHGGATVVLDHRAVAHRGTGANCSVEPAISLAASVAFHLRDDDRHVRLVSHNGRQLAAGRDLADDLLAALAVLDLDQSTAVATEPLATRGLLIGIFGSLDTRTAALVAAAHRQVGTAIALIMATEDWPQDAGQVARDQRSDSHGEARRILAAAGWRVVLIRRGGDLARAWQQACAEDDPALGLEIAGGVR